MWANNSGGSLMAYLNITILDIVPEIAYTPENMTLTNDTSVVDWLPVNIGGPALTWSISPALSEGLEFNETTGHITGTPTEVMDVRTYVVTATTVVVRLQRRSTSLCLIKFQWLPSCLMMWFCSTTPLC